MEVKMKEKHIVLRNPRPNTGDPFLGPLAGVAAVVPAPAPTVEVNEVERRDLPALARAADVIAVAPVMPMRLIAPVEIQEVAAPAAPTIEWGIKAVKADTSPFSGDGVVVAVLDTGIDASHPAFAGVEIIQKDFTGEGNGDNHGHGTHCAGTIFGRSVNNRRIGVAPGVKKALIGKVLGGQGGGSDQIVSAIQWAIENGAHVISMSLGIDFPGFVKRLENGGLATEPATSLALEGYRANVQLFERQAALIRAMGAFLQGAIIVAAAGNESQRPEFEIAVSPPAVAEGIISVAALGQATNGFAVAPFSNEFANVSAPGVQIVSARPGGGLATMSGTSMATPHVAGVAALWAEKIMKSTGSLNTLQLTARLLGSATTAGLQAGFDPSDIGIGLVGAPQN
jgi:subtilisin family serine protease